VFSLPVFPVLPSDSSSRNSPTDPAPNPISAIIKAVSKVLHPASMYVLMLMGSLNGFYSDLNIKYLTVICKQDLTRHFHLAIPNVCGIYAN